MSRIEILKALIRAVRDGNYLGDVAGLKSALFKFGEEKSKHGPAVIPLLARNRIPISVPELLKFPPGSFGREYGEFLKKWNLQPFNFSGKHENLFANEPVLIRYVRIHDMVHTLLGFDTSLEGELGVYSFIAAQDYSATLNKAARWAKLGYPIFKPHRRPSLTHAHEVGTKLATVAKLLITEPLEDYFGEPMQVVRERLRLKV